MVSCKVKKCPHVGSKSSRNFCKMFIIPAAPERRDQWLSIMNQFELTNSQHFCCCHFNPTDVMASGLLKSGSFPIAIEIKVPQTIQSSEDQENQALYQFMRNKKNEKYRRPLQDILEIVSQKTRSYTDVQKVESGLFEIVKTLSLDSECEKCGHRNIDAKSEIKIVKVKDLKKNLNSFRDLCEQTLRPVIGLPRVPSDVSTVWKPSPLAIRAKRTRKPPAVFNEEEIEAENNPIIEVIGNKDLIQEPVGQEVKEVFKPSETEIQALKFLKRESPPLKEEDFYKFFTMTSKGGKCPKCDQDFDTMSKLLFHEPCRYKKLYADPTCPICNQKWKRENIKSCFKHMESKHFQSKKFKCLICPEDKEFTTRRRDTMIRHCQMIHIGSKRFSCSWPECGKGFKYRTGCLRHIMIDHLKKMSFKCDICGKGFMKKKVLDLHSLVHTTSLKDRSFYHNYYECPLEGCPKKNIIKPEGLKTHLKLKHPNGGYDVDQVIKKAEAIREIKRLQRVRPKSEITIDMSEDGTPKIIVGHPDIIIPEMISEEVPELTYDSIEELERKAMEYIHQEEKDPLKSSANLIEFTPVQESCPYRTCQETFDQKAKAIAHPSCQSQIRKDSTGNLICEICQQSYAGRAALKKHLDFHFGKQFTCLLCLKGFFDNHHAKTHVSEVHNSDRKFSCKMTGCGKKLRESRSALAHIIGYHFHIYPFNCNYCTVKTVSQYEMNNHLIKCHPREEDLIYPCFQEGCQEKFSSITTRKQHLKVNHREFLWTEDHRKQDQIDRNQIKGKGELINGQLVLLEAAGVRKSHENRRSRIRVHGKKQSLTSGTKANRRETGIKRPRGATSKSPGKRKSRRKNESDDEAYKTVQPTGIIVHRPQFNSNQSMAKTINQPSTLAAAHHSTTTVEAVHDPTDYWYQHQPFATPYVSMPNIMTASQSDSGTYDRRSKLTVY